MKQTDIYEKSFVLYKDEIYQVNKITRKGLVELIRVKNGKEERFSVPARDIISDVKITHWYEVDYENSTITPREVIHVEKNSEKASLTKITFASFNVVHIGFTFFPSWLTARDALLIFVKKQLDDAQERVRFWEREENKILSMAIPE
jgi:hypothetical protein